MQILEQNKPIQTLKKLHVWSLWELLTFPVTTNAVAQSTTLHGKDVFDQIITSLIKKKNMITYSCRRYLYF